MLRHLLCSKFNLVASASIKFPRKKLRFFDQDTKIQRDSLPLCSCAVSIGVHCTRCCLQKRRPFIRRRFESPPSDDQDSEMALITTGTRTSQTSTFLTVDEALQLSLTNHVDLQKRNWSYSEYQMTFCHQSTRRYFRSTNHCSHSLKRNWNSQYFGIGHL